MKLPDEPVVKENLLCGVVDVHEGIVHIKT